MGFFVVFLNFRERNLQNFHSASNLVGGIKNILSPKKVGLILAVSSIFQTLDHFFPANKMVIFTFLKNEARLP